MNAYLHIIKPHLPPLHQHLILIGLLFFLNSHRLTAQNISFFPDTIWACKDDSIKLSIPKEILSKSVQIQWITPYSIVYHTSSLSVFHEGKYLLKLKTKQSEISDSLIILKSEKPTFKVNDTTLCIGKNLYIPLSHSTYKFFLPNTKQPIQQLLISHPGKYTIEVSNKGCKNITQFEVKSISPTIPEQKEYTFCINDENKKISVKHNGIANILWNTGAKTPTITIDKEDAYWIKTYDKYCGARTDTIYVKFKPCNCEILIPNVFTPNDDGNNDFFMPVLSCEYAYYNLTIYDKWNNIVFTSHLPNAKWDGKYKGNPLPEDVYIYKIETIEKHTDKKHIRTGKISLIR